MWFLLKVVTVYSGEKEEFDCKNNNGCGKAANFWLDNISKINYKTLVIVLYISSGLGSRKIQLVQMFFK